MRLGRKEEGTGVIILNDLPRQHPLRNRPLGEIKAECRNRQSKALVNMQAWNISKATFNQLATVWTDNNEFRAPE